MGREKSTVVTQGSSTQQYTPTAEETALNKLQLDQATAADPYQRELQKSGLQTQTSLLNGQALPGYLNGLTSGISDDDVNASIQEGMRQLNPFFQQSGILNSGAAASIAARFAGEQKLAQKQFNLGNLQQLLNIATGNQALPQASVLEGANQVGTRLAGLRTGTSSYQGNQTTYGMNPFMKSFEQSFGKTLGSPKMSMGPMSFGGA